MPIIEAEHLTKRFKELTAVNDVTLEVAERECFGLLGPNGAGKTSLIRMLTAVSPPARGDIRVMGKDLLKYPREVKALLGVVPQNNNLDEDLNVLQNLLTFARYFSIRKDEAARRSLEVLRMMQLEERQKARILELSGGMKRRLLIGRALLNNPRIIFLDEPSIGLDPQAKYMVWQKLKELKARGVTLFLCTQNMEEAARLCERVAVMNLGRIIATGSPEQLIRQHVGSQVREIEPEAAGRDALVREIERRKLDYGEMAGIIQIFNASDAATEGLPGRDRPANLEDVFLKLTGRSLLE